mmetsp:Transcript_17955/g.26322  ORF Transcript_17955/g.26322 Transcript_17955/m.26322 type:complete len:81 (-) Transcript_17955:1185-1427(-)
MISAVCPVSSSGVSSTWVALNRPGSAATIGALRTTSSHALADLVSDTSPEQKQRRGPGMGPTRAATTSGCDIPYDAGFLP